MKTILSIGMTLLTGLVLLFSPESIPAQEEGQDQMLEQPKMVDAIYKIKYRDVTEIYRLIRGFNSRFGFASADRESSVLVVRDTPEILSKIEEIINAADIQPDNINLTFFLFAVKKGEEINIPENLPGRVKGGLVELAEAMAYRSFQVVSSGLLTINPPASERGYLSLTGNDGKVFDIYFKPVYNRQGRYLRMDELTMQLMPGEQPGRRMLMTDIGLEDDGAAVVGASRLDGGDEALVLVVTMKVQ
jgi:hypothetical protein